MPLTSREIAIAILPKITGGLSMAGSGWIAYRVLSNRQKRHKTYHRLVALMSLCDVISSFSYFLSTWPIPQGENKGWGSPYHYQAVGTAATCSAQGFGIQFGVTTAFFNIMLAIHYLLVIKFNYTEGSIQRKEPYMWGTALAIGLGLSVPGLFLQMYNNSNLWCWISPNWDLCEQQGLTRDQCVDRTYLYRWAFYYGPLWTCIGLITMAQIWLWWTVRQLEVKVSKWRRTDSRAVRMRQSRRVAVQAAWYMAVFIITWLPYTAIAMTGKYFNPHDDTGFVVLLFVVICQPIQGLLNVFVYHRHSLKESTARAASHLAANARSFRRKSGKGKPSAQQRVVEQLRDEMKDVRLTITERAHSSAVDLELATNQNIVEEDEPQETPKDASHSSFFRDATDPTGGESEATEPAGGELIEPTDDDLQDLHEIYD